MMGSKSPVSIVRQCELLDVCRATHYYKPTPAVRDDAKLCRRIDELFTERPFLGSRGMMRALRREGIWCNRKRVQRLMREMGLESVAPKLGVLAPMKKSVPTATKKKLRD